MSQKKSKNNTKSIRQPQQPTRQPVQMVTPKSLLNEIDRILEEMKEESKSVILTADGKDENLPVPKDRNDLINFILWTWVNWYNESKKKSEPRIITP